MEYIEGDTLSGLLRRASSIGAPLDPSVALRILLDALAGLHAAHELTEEDGRHVGLVHRDFSPQNILVGTDGVGRLADFGIAKAASRLGATRTGTVKGKIAYMSPEQALGQHVDRRCDVWAAGVVAWELIAGRRLYASSGDEIGTLFRIATEIPPRLSSVCHDVPASVDDAVAHALTPDLAGRTPTAAAFARELGHALRGTPMDAVESSEVADVVARLVGPKLAARRSRVKEVLSLRSELGRVAQSSTVERSTPGASLLASRATTPDTDPANDATTAVVGRGPSPAPDVSRTDVSAVSSGAQLALVQMRPRAKAPAIVVAVGIALVALILFARPLLTNTPDPNAANESVPNTSPSARAAMPEAPAASAAETPRASVAPSAHDAARSGSAAASSAPAWSPSAHAAAGRTRARPPSGARPVKKQGSFLDQQH